MSSFFSSLANKAQAAYNSHNPRGSDSSEGGGFTSHHTIQSLQHQLRTLQQQYSSSTTPVQKIVTTQKGIAIDLDSLSRDTQAHSKEIYLWGQNEADDLKDVSDRFGWLNFVSGTLSHNLATQIYASRGSFKELRLAETNIAPRRAVRSNLENQISKIEHENAKNAQGRLAELKEQLKRAEMEDHSDEKEIEILKRKALKESEKQKWEAIREYAEKLILLSQAAEALLPALPTIPPTLGSPYTGTDTTAGVRASLQQALDNYKPGPGNLVLGQADLKRSDTRSFGVTHATELSHLDSVNPVRPSTPITPPPPTTGSVPPSAYHPPAGPPPHLNTGPSPGGLSATSPALAIPASVSPPVHASSPPPSATMSPPLNPAVLNQAPAPIPPSPESAQKVSAVVAPDPEDPSTKVPSVMPTVAETGLPKSAGPDGPGPASGSLLTLKAEHDSTQNAAKSSPGYASSPLNSSISPPKTTPKYESAEEEKRRLAQQDRDRILQGGSGSGESQAPKYESAEEEKKRLEREEREKVLSQGGPHDGPSGPKGGPPPPGDDSDLPPYQEF